MWGAGVPLWPREAQSIGKGEERLWDRLHTRDEGRECGTAGFEVLSLEAQGPHPGPTPPPTEVGALSLVLESCLR